eukprot:13481732-Alexandrium_andersonii.AAC.1
MRGLPNLRRGGLWGGRALPFGRRLLVAAAAALGGALGARGLPAFHGDEVVHELLQLLGVRRAEIQEGEGAVLRAHGRRHDD